jgi:hypothetical protein
MATALWQQSKTAKVKGLFTRKSLAAKLPVQMKAAKKKPQKRGTKPEMLKLNGNWQAAIKKSFQKKRPANGWPKIAS